MKYTGERIIPKQNCGCVEGHNVLYAKSLPYCKDKFVLDSACGVGWGTEFLAQEAAYVIGADIDSTTIEYARKEYPQKNFTFCVADITHLPFPNEIFDVVNSIETVEHVKRNSIETVIGEFRRVLKPGGLLLISTPDQDRYPYQPKTDAEVQGFHLWHYSQNELTVLLRPFFEVTIEKPGSLYVICRKK